MNQQCSLPDRKWLQHHCQSWLFKAPGIEWKLQTEGLFIALRRDGGGDTLHWVTHWKDRHAVSASLFKCLTMFHEQQHRDTTSTWLSDIATGSKQRSTCAGHLQLQHHHPQVLQQVITWAQLAPQCLQNHHPTHPATTFPSPALQVALQTRTASLRND